MREVALKSAHAFLRIKAGFLGTQTDETDFLPVQNVISPFNICALPSSQVKRI